MTEIIVERRWPEPVTDAGLAAMANNAVGCLDMHRVTWKTTMLSADRHDTICHFSAPDTESVRIALRQSGEQTGRAWAGTIHDAPGLAEADVATANVIVGREFDSPAAFEEIQALEDAGRGCLETHRVSFIRTYFSTDRKRMICLYRAPDAESVRVAQREAGMPVSEVLAFLRFTPDDI